MVVFPRLYSAIVGGKDRQQKQGRQQDPRTDNRGADQKVEDEEGVMPRDSFRATVDRRYREEMGLGWSVLSFCATTVPADTDCRVNNLLCNSDGNGCKAEPDAREKKQVIEVVPQREGTKGTISSCRKCFEKPIGQYNRSTVTQVSSLREEHYDSKTSMKKLSDSMFVQGYPGKIPQAARKENGTESQRKA